MDYWNCKIIKNVMVVESRIKSLFRLIEEEKKKCINI